MPESSPTARAEKLRGILNRANHDYYVLSQPALSDSEYDSLFRELQQIEEDHPELKTSDSPTLRVGVATVRTVPTGTTPGTDAEPQQRDQRG